MICPACLRRGAALAAFRPAPCAAPRIAPIRSRSRPIAAAATASAATKAASSARFLSSTAPKSDPTASSSSSSSTEPKLEPLIGGTAAAAGAKGARGGTLAKAAPPMALSSCPAGTVLKGLNYLKGRTDPVALPDEEYPEWLWSCLEVKKRSGEEGGMDTGEFSRSKKQRRMAAKRQRGLEAQMLAEGNIDALIPKVPLEKQTVNLPGSEDGSVADNLGAAKAREDLRRAMRKDRRAKIKEANYLKKL